MKFATCVLVAGFLCCATGAATAQDSIRFKPLRLDGNGVRWQASGTYGKPVISYSIVAEDAQFPNARNCRKMTRLDGLMSASAVAPAALRAEIDAAFAMWQAAANIAFREADSPQTADILIGAQIEPEGWAFADVFYDLGSPAAVKPISRSLICLNPEKRWKIGFDGDLKTYDLRYTIAHEIGHAIGLDHPSGAGQIMGYRYEERFRELQTGDVAGAVLLYGQHVPEAVTAGRTPPTADRALAARPDVEQGGTRGFTARSP